MAAIFLEVNYEGLKAADSGWRVSRKKTSVDADRQLFRKEAGLGGDCVVLTCWRGLESDRFHSKVTF